MLTRRQFFSYGGLLGLATSASYWGNRYLNRQPTISLNKIGLSLGHALRDAQIAPQNRSEHSCSVLIVGSGAAALSAAWYLAKHGERDVLLLEGIERNGNNAAYVSGHVKAPTGAHYLAQPSKESIYVRELLQDLGILLGFDARTGQPIYHEMDLVHAPDERVFFEGRWHDGLTIADADSERFFQFIQKIKYQFGSDGRKLFAIPIVHSSADWRYLDTQTFGEWLRQQGYHSSKLLWYLDYCCKDDYGQGIEQVSAFAGLHYFAARGSDQDAVLTWADGLNHLSERIRQFIDLKELKSLPEENEWHFPSPVSYDASAIEIEELADAVAVVARHNQTGEQTRILAKKVICAMPLMIASRIVKHGERYGLGLGGNLVLPENAPWLISNFVLKQFPEEIQKHELAWDNIVHGSRGLGYVVATHQRIGVAKPEKTIFTAYTALNHDTPANIRRSLLNAQATDLIETAAQDVLAVYGKSFWKNVEHLDLTVRAHAMSVPKVGYLSQSGLEQLRQHQSRIVFAHSDLSSYSVFEEANFWGVEAAKKVLLRDERLSF